MRVKGEILRRVTITGSQTDRARAFKYCEKRGLRITFIGPPPLRGKRLAEYRMKGHIGRIFDSTRFKLVAEGPMEAV